MQHKYEKNFPLIVDADADFIKEIKGDPKAQKTPPFCAATGKEAQVEFAKHQAKIAGVFINPEVVTPGGGPEAVSVIRFCRQRSRSIPIYLIYNNECKVDPTLLVELAVADQIKKPIPYGKILQLVAPEVIMLEPIKAQADGKGKEDALGSETHVNDSEFVSILAKDFVSGSKTHFHLYVRLGENKYVKILNADEVFAPERLATYLHKGVKYFYLRKEDQEHYLRLVHQLSSQAIKADGISTSAKMSMTMNLGQETMSFLKKQGLSVSTITQASNFVEKVHDLVDVFGIGEMDAFRDFSKNLALYEHGIGTSMITSLLSNVTGIHSDAALQIVGIASLFHDVGLADAPEKVQTENEYEMSDEEKKIFYEHPAKGAEILSKIPGSHATVIQAVLQHHERRNKKFGDHERVKNVNRVAEIIGIADEYLKLVDRVKKGEELNIQREFELKIFPGFSTAVVDAFKNVFFQKKKKP